MKVRRHSSFPAKISLYRDFPAGSRDPPGALASQLALESVSRTLSAYVTTLGIGLSGVKVVDVLVDGPADKSGVIEVGDEIVQVDGVGVTGATLNRFLIGTDVPQTTVALTLRKTDEGRAHVAIKRMASSEVAWKRCMFETLGKLVASADARGSGDDAAAAKSLMSLWRAGQKHSSAYDRAVEAGLSRLQSDLVRLSTALVNRLGRMNDLGLDSLSKLEQLWRHEQDLRDRQKSMQYREAVRMQLRCRYRLLLSTWAEWQLLRASQWLRQEETAMEEKLAGTVSRLVVVQAQLRKTHDSVEALQAERITGTVFDQWHTLQIRSCMRARARALLSGRRRSAAVRSSLLAWQGVVKCNVFKRRRLQAMGRRQRCELLGNGLDAFVAFATQVPPALSQLSS